MSKSSTSCLLILCAAAAFASTEAASWPWDNLFKADANSGSKEEASVTENLDFLHKYILRDQAEVGAENDDEKDSQSARPSSESKSDQNATAVEVSKPGGGVVNVKLDSELQTAMMVSRDRKQDVHIHGDFNKLEAADAENLRRVKSRD
mmetsp:Transcript_106203/g.184158  ORF Transcript_106203/g.184158 Transcript_106203/m.184158 type:complete len:149 (-) Transcript_106203:69-515(-)